MIYIIGGSLYQWDTGRKVEIIPRHNTTVEQVHFNGGLVVEPVKIDNHYVAAIPNSLLRESKKITVYAVMVKPDGTQTTTDRSFSVKKKEKPDEYVQETATAEMADEVICTAIGSGVLV